MKLPRISIKMLMTYVALVAIAFVALIRPHLGWSIFLSLISGIILLTSILGVILRRGPEQAFWIGFGLFGWVSYLVGTLSLQTSDNHSGLSQIASVIELGLTEFINNSTSNPGSHTNILNKLLVRQALQPMIHIALCSQTLAFFGGQIARFLARGGPFDPRPTTPA
jgi:hypothetical protein